jgi:hypothetical protein
LPWHGTDDWCIGYSRQHARNENRRGWPLEDYWS